jgi:hypothetical protein
MNGKLSVKMTAWLDHVRATSEQGITIRGYAARHGLSVASLYQAKSVLTGSEGVAAIRGPPCVAAQCSAVFAQHALCKIRCV